MNLLSPAIALLRPLSGRMRVWVLPIPMILAPLSMVVLALMQAVPREQEGTVSVLMTGAGLAVWLYLQAAYFSITRGEGDRMDHTMTEVSHGNLAQQVPGGERT